MNQASDQWCLIDSHVHLDMTYRNNPGQLVWLKDEGCLPISWAFAPRVDSISDLRHYLDYQKMIFREINRHENRCYFLAGIHPRNIPGDLKSELVRELVLPSLDDDYCLGLGEIGLEKNTSHEREILLAQLDLAEEVVDRGKIFGIHTPRRNKDVVTRETLKLLKPYLVFREQIVIDHCNKNTIQSVLKSGLWVGITLNPIKTSFQDLSEITDTYLGSLGRIMLNTDSGGSFYDDLVRFYHSQEFDQEVRRQLASRSAARFFGL